MALGKLLHFALQNNLGYYRHGDMECGRGDNPMWTLTNDCFRLGVMWPAVNLLLAAMVFIYLILTPWEVGRSETLVHHVSGILSHHDNRLRVARASIAVSVLGAATALGFLSVSSGSSSTVREHERLYWQSQMVYWVVVAAAFGRQAAGFRGGNQKLFHWPLFAATLGQLCLCVLFEGYYAFFTGDHLHERPGASAHSRFVLVSVALSSASALLPLDAHKLGFFLPKGQRKANATATSPSDAAASGASVGDNEAGDNAAIAGAEVDSVYKTPLSRVRDDQIPLVESPEHVSSIFGQLVFSWVTPVLKLGTKVTIESGDLYLLNTKDRPLSVWRRFVSFRRPDRSLLRTLGATFAPQLILQVLFAVVGAVLSYAGPFFLQRILRSIRLYGKHEGSLEGGSVTSRLIYLDAIGLLLSSLLHSLTSNQVLWLGRKVSMRLQSLLVAELSSKALQRRSKSSGAAASKKKKDDASESKVKEDEDKTANSDGRIVNMLTSDLESVGHIASYLDDIYTIPIGFCIGTWYLYSLLGVPAMIGLTLTAIYYPLTRLMVKYLIKYQKKLMALDDERVTMITEMFQGIRAVKLFGWQTRFIEKVRAKRDEELSANWKLLIFQLPVSFIRSLTTSLILAATLAIYTLVFGNTLTADIIFPSITVFSMVSSTFNRIPGMFSWMTRCYVSLKRIETFMVQSHVQDLGERVAKPASSNGSEDGVLDALEVGSIIGFVNASLIWSVEAEATEPNAAANTASTTAATTAVASVHSGSPSRDEFAEITAQTPLVASSQGASYAAIGQAPSEVMSDSEEYNERVSPVTAVDILPPALEHTSKDATANKVGMASFSLNDITLLFPTGGLSIIVGPTGSGKSSLLAALIGEMTLTSGRIILPTADPRSLDAKLASGKYVEVMELARQGLVMANVAYVSQEAWLRNATIRENILFGQPYDQQRYEEVLRVCALKPDLRILTAGDLTEIGERGVTLSGGQKQRVALARAVYSDRRILLIDDCLSAVDAHTGKHILNQCLVGETSLMQGRTRVLVTHHVTACLPHCNYVAVLREGRVAMSGSPHELQSLGHFANEVIAVDQKIAAESEFKTPELTEQGEEEAEQLSSPDVNDMHTEDEYNRKRRLQLAEQRGLDPNGDLSELDDVLVEDEECEQGYVRPDVWISYMRMCGPLWFWVSILGFVFIGRGTYILQDYWVRMWMSNAGEGSSVVYWLSSYVLIGMMGTSIRLGAMLNENAGSMRAGRQYHEELFIRVMNASPRFFDKTPIGRVISRFSRDMRTIDDSILGSIIFMISQIMQVVSVFVIISAVTPPFAVIAVLMCIAYSMLAVYYLNATRELKRLDSISMSPLLSLFSELITGVESIRAFGAQNQYTMEAMNRVDTHNRPYYLMWAANRWLCSRIEFSGCLVAFTTIVLILLNLDNIDAGLAGFVMMYAISFSDNMLWFIRNYSDCEISMNSVERVNQYLKIDQEAAAFADDANRPPTSWPASGAVQVSDLVIEYVPGTPVLHGISFAAAHGEKIGVVGRTGAGKSTLSLAFLRFIETTSGSIVVDNVDIAKIGLEELRRNFTIIPQDPVLFNGTIRFNLDPFDEFPEALLWDALKRSHLVRNDSEPPKNMSPALTPTTSSSLSIAAKSTDESIDEVSKPGDTGLADDHAGRMAGIFNSLDAEIKENGQNLSLGQRQLVALARALVRRSRLIIMDEATASVDFDTDDRIQRTIRGSEFSNSTLFCIAHRLRTVIDYDRVLVLDKGKIVEFDTPWNLLQKENSQFRSMCEKTGEYDHLYKIAQSKN
ncbi:hypothetical protein LPJ66_000593 [Kickxella alabastrina]|uniref:Uncharacterized protein n=1 Tax=Kickxella alabastrina TaxID=61397 RepID=A0ACC1IVI2_9FUNG|nr:hypothetical protein LPJ66_000593 [Kickxella alabastrina]